MAAPAMPVRKAASVPIASETPSTMHAIDPSTRIHRPSRRSGSVRCGEAVAINAAATVSREAKYAGGVSALNASDRSVETSFPKARATSAMKPQATSRASTMSRRTRLRPWANSIASISPIGQIRSRS